MAALFVIVIFVLHSASGYAFDNDCGVNYFNGWCKDKKKEAPADNKKSESDPYVWQPKFANEPPPPLVDAFRDPSPENIARYREWYKKRMERIDELGRTISGLSTQPQPPAINTKPEQPAVSETKPIIFNKAVYFFSEGCPMCAKMTPLLLEFQSTGKLVGIGINSTDRSAAAYLLRNGVRIPSAADYSGDIARNYNVSAVPALILLSDKGEVVGRHEGAMDKAALSRFLREAESK